jgi:very-short-patch-repair endonuclease
MTTTAPTKAGLDDVREIEECGVPEDGAVNEDVFSVSDLGGEPAAVLDALRTRLLDLTLTNRVLNFRPAGPRVVRVIDELPDQLFARLRAGAELELLPVPAPGEKHALQARVRAPAGKKERRAAAEAYAKELGFNVSYELPRSTRGQDVPDRHQDDAIQTLLFPGDLEADLRTLLAEARSAIEEKGSNILYLVFGLLEWYERDDSEKKIHSPLVMLPVSLRRGDPDRKTGAYRFYLSHTDEDVLSNISLQEKLRRDHKLTLPEIADDESPEDYLDRLAAEVPLLPRWRVCREVALGLLSFTKLFMFRDLDPGAWPKSASPLEHPLLLRLFGGTGTGDEYAAEYDFEGGDRGAAPKHVPPIIMDADSSQHSAIVDAMQGRSLVIEGPPGTGKSQTIANLIASALADGKSVLFVADKLTALQVVSKRLDDAGLGMFCLELHSDRTQKSRLMDDIRKRLEVRGKLRPPPKLEERLQVLQATRTDLNAYAQRMNTPSGAMRWKIHDILWGTQRRRSLLAKDAKIWSELVLRNVEHLTLDRYEALRSAARTFSQLLHEVRPAGARLDQHPFYGAWPNDPRVDAEEYIVRALEALVRAARAAAEHLAIVRSQLGESVPFEAPALGAWADRVHLLGPLSQSANMGTASHLRDHEARHALLGWCARVREYGRQRANVYARIPSPSTRQLLLESRTAFEGFTPFARVNDIAAAPHAIAEVSGQLIGGQAVLVGFATWLGLPGLPQTVEAVAMISELLAAINSVRLEVLAFRTPAADESELVFDAAARRAAELAEERARLNEAFQLDLLPADPTLLEGHASTCATAGFFSFLSSAFRAAERLFALLCRHPRRFTKLEMAEGFKALAAYRRKLDAFSNDAELRQLFGPAFRGLETNFEAMRAAREWQLRIHGVARRFRALAPSLGAVATAPLERLRELRDLAEQCSPGLTQLPGSLQAILDMRATKHLAASLSIAEAVAELQETAALANIVLASARALGAAPTVDVASLQGLRADLESLARLETELACATLPKEVLGPTYVFPNVPVPVAEQTVAYAEQLWAAETPAAVRQALLDRPNGEELERLDSFFVRGKELIHTTEAAEQALIAAASITAADWYGHSAPRSLDGIIGRTSRALDERHTLSPWLAYLRARIALGRAGGEQLRETAERNPDIDTSRLDVAAELLVYGSLARRVYDLHPDLRRHEGFAHTNVREKFREYDLEIMRLQREQLAARVDERPVPEGVKSASVKSRTELALINHELGKQRAHIPIRQLVNRAGAALRGLKPCFMMSPRSVAQYLRPGAHQFDLVIMDEASQLRPEDAMGALTRGKQAVIVGDSKQLPPTSFFSGSATDDGDEEFIVETKESILDLAKTAFKPVRQLRWHYRSRHGSLIAFSNREYYDNNLIVFPSPSDGSDDLGVKYVEVADGTCVGGINEREAERVVDAVLEHLRTRPHESFGAVAMNVKQKQRIEVLLSDRLKDQPELRSRFDSGTEGAHAFIKNLESVQGDERDVIFISVTYGPTTPRGRVPRTFGPLNQSSGWRRLNVLFTRAKKRVVVFSSFAPEALEGGELSRGASDLKKYLTFARSGLDLPGETTDRAPDSDFEVEVAEALRDAGYPVVPQVGVAGYFIDLAVKHPVRRTEFILGVECDGAAYHSSFSARDRDRLRQQVLEGLGWKIYRIWSTDWFRDPVGQKKRLVEAVKALS